MSNRSAKKTLKKTASGRANRSGGRLHAGLRATPTFRDALQDMRVAAQEGVQDAISRAHLMSPPPNAKGRPRLAAGHTSQALFDGVCEALAEAIIETAKPGAEVAILGLVVDLLESKVQKRLCSGAC